ncbi:MAG: hypothetical protein ABEJ90_01770 [Halobacterium sp.]
MTDSDARDPSDLPEEIREEVPVWDDEYFDRVSDRLMFSYDLERDRRVRGECFDLYGEFRMRNQKQFLHPALSYADHDTEEYVFARRTDDVSVADLEALASFGDDLAADWVDADEEHYETNFTFVVVTDAVPDNVRSFVRGFRDRTLLKYGYYGHYEVNLVAVAPHEEVAVESEASDLAQALALWGDVETTSEGFFSRFAKRFWT